MIYIVKTTEDPSLLYLLKLAFNRDAVFHRTTDNTAPAVEVPADGTPGARPFRCAPQLHPVACLGGNG